MSKYRFFGQSPSSIGTFETCARQYEAKYLTREVTFTPNEATMYGDRFHKAVEPVLDGAMSTAALPEEFTHLAPVIEAVQAWPGKMFPEYEAACDANWQPVSWRQRLLGCRIDVLNIASDKPQHARILDWKTGKPRDDYGQLDINALLIFHLVPTVQTIRAAFAYTKTGGLSKKDYTREKLPEYKAKIEQKIHRIKHAHEHGLFPPTPSGLCRGWCDVKSCEFNKGKA